MSAPPIQPPMTGSWRVRVHAVRPFSIHGDLYFEVHVTRLDDPAERMLAVRIPRHAAPTTPVSGQVLELAFLMGQVTSARAAG